MPPALVEGDPARQLLALGCAERVRVQLDAEMAHAGDRGADRHALRAPGGVGGAGADMRSHDLRREKGKEPALHAHPRGRIDIVAGPKPVDVWGKACIRTPAAAR